MRALEESFKLNEQNTGKFQLKRTASGKLYGQNISTHCFIYGGGFKLTELRQKLNPND